MKNILLLSALTLVSTLAVGCDKKDTSTTTTTSGATACAKLKACCAAIDKDRTTYTTSNVVTICEKPQTEEGICSTNASDVRDAIKKVGKPTPSECL
jgi:hypothetical protein